MDTYQHMQTAPFARRPRGESPAGSRGGAAPFDTHANREVPPVRCSPSSGGVPAQPPARRSSSSGGVRAPHKPPPRYVCRYCGIRNAACNVPSNTCDSSECYTKAFDPSATTLCCVCGEVKVCIVMNPNGTQVTYPTCGNRCRRLGGFP